MASGCLYTFSDDNHLKQRVAGNENDEVRMSLQLKENDPVLRWIGMIFCNLRSSSCINTCRYILSMSDVNTTLFFKS